MAADELIGARVIRAAATISNVFRIFVSPARYKCNRLATPQAPLLSISLRNIQWPQVTRLADISHRVRQDTSRDWRLHERRHKPRGPQRQNGTDGGAGHYVAQEMHPQKDARSGHAGRAKQKSQQEVRIEVAQRYGYGKRRDGMARGEGKLVRRQQ